MAKLRGTTVRELTRELERIAPARYAESWDNVGLLAGAPDKVVRRVLLAVDFTKEVCDEALLNKAEMVVCYHPPIFEGLKRIAHDSSVGRAMAHDLALYSLHTALDAAPGGTNDVLAEILGLADTAPLVPRSADEHHKLVTFVPAYAVEKLSQALFAGGAGHIGHYSGCSFRSEGTGTFFGEAGAQPRVGKAGRTEEVAEVRLETLVPQGKLATIISLLRQAHPYEEPAFDVVRLVGAPSGVGMGRIGKVKNVSRGALLGRIKRGLGVDTLLVAGPTRGKVQRAAVCAGAGGEFLRSAMAQGAEVYVTGEMRHHDALTAARAGVTVVCTRHTVGERPVLARVAAQLTRAVSIEARTSRVDEDVFAFV